MRKLIFPMLVLLLLCACGKAPVEPEMPAAPSAATEQIPEAPEEPAVEEEPNVIYDLMRPAEGAAADKCAQDPEAGTVVLDQLGMETEPPVIEFLHQGQPMAAEVWALSGIVRVESAGQSAGVTFRCASDSRNFAEFILLRQTGGTNGVRRNITRQGVRMQEKGDEVVLNSLRSADDWSARFCLLCRGGFVYLFLQEEGKEMQLVTAYSVDWPRSGPVFEVTKNARVTFSQLSTATEKETVEALYRTVGVKGPVKDTKRVLFLGNSGIFYYDTPNTFSRLARGAGYLVEVGSIAKSSAKLSHHADKTNYLGKLTLQELEKGYDLVFLQEITSCINSQQNGDLTRLAVRSLSKTIRSAGSEPVLYVRAPKNDYTDGRDPVIAGRQLDQLFGPLGQELSAECCYVNRAFALVYDAEGLNLWHTDRAHQNARGSYLAACVLFSTVFDTSCQVLGDDGLPPEEALMLRTYADRVVLEGVIPWE